MRDENYPRRHEPGGARGAPGRQESYELLEGQKGDEKNTYQVECKRKLLRESSAPSTTMHARGMHGGAVRTWANCARRVVARARHMARVRRLEPPPNKRWSISAEQARWYIWIAINTRKKCPLHTAL